MSTLTLSLFPGIGLLDMAFELEGFCVVRGPDVLWGGDVRRFQPPADKFDGLIGGPPCQAFSAGARLRRKVQDPVNLIPEFERCVAEAAPTWFLMENVRRAPLPQVPGYVVHALLLNNRWCGGEQSRLRRFSFGTRDGRKFLPETQVFEPIIRKRAVLASDGKRAGKGTNLPDRNHTLSAAPMSFREACALQGLPEDFLADAPFTKEGRWRVVGNGVPLPMGRAIARAVKEALNAPEAS